MVTEDDRRWPPGLHGLPARNGKIRELERFDSDFFNVHGKQARVMAPHLRTLLEVSYEAWLDAGIDPADLSGSGTGVYIGSCGSDSNIAWLRDVHGICGYEQTGNAQAMFANRLSFFYDFRGPSKNIDTACSSSLVAFHDAVRDLEDGVCDYAVVGGTNVILWPSMSVGFLRLKMLSPTGACRAFDAKADGYVRSEGIGVVILTAVGTCPDAYASVRSSGVNSDGYTPEGITFPSSARQAELYRAVCSRAAIDPGEISFIEAHGTGTVAGDAQELAAIDECYGRGAGRSAENPLWIGSVKSNIGHCEAASGIAGLIKLLLTFENGVLPPNLHFSRPNPSSAGLLEGRLRVPIQPVPWTGGLAAVNSFGFGGTNAHLILEGSPARSDGGSRHPVARRVMPFYSRTEEGIKNLLTIDGEDGVPFVRPARDLRKFPYRGVRREAGQEWRRVAAGSSPALWFVCSGLGTEWQGMGRSLYQQHLRFRESLEASAAGLRQTGVDLLGLFRAESNPWTAAVPRTVGLVALQIALIDLLAGWGVRPDGCIGHGAGEIACGYVDGALSREQAVRLAYQRGRAASDAGISGGLMAGAQLTVEEAEEVLKGAPLCAVACHNSPEGVTLSGPADQLRPFLDRLRARGIYVQDLDTDGIPYHSPAVRSAEGILLSALKQFLPETANSSPRWIPTNGSAARKGSAEYFAAGCSLPVLFHEALSQLPRGVLTVEVGPGSGLTSAIRQTRPDVRHIPLVEPSGDGEGGVDSALAELWLNGVPLEWPRCDRRPSRRVRDIQMAWNHNDRFPVPSYRDFPAGAAAGEEVFSFELDLQNEYRYLLDHSIDGRILIPAVSFLYAVWQAVAQDAAVPLERCPVRFKDVAIRQAVQVNEDSRSITLTVHLKHDHRFELFREGELIAEGSVFPEEPEERPDDDPHLLTAYHRYPHGFVAIPALIAFQDLFPLLEGTEGITLGVLAERSGARPGFAKALLRLFEAMGWIESRGGERYRWSGGGKLSDRRVDPDLLSLLDVRALRERFSSGGPSPLGRWIVEMSRRWGREDPVMVDFLDGFVAVAVLAALRAEGLLGDASKLETDLLRLHEDSRHEVAELFRILGWGDTARDEVHLNARGRYFLEQSAGYQAVASYYPLLARLPKLLFDDPAAQRPVEAPGEESHVDRVMNIRGSGFQHLPYFRDVDDVIVSIFDAAPVEEQPDYIVDMGCGDGTLLRRMYDTIARRTRRGRELTEHPLVMVGADPSKAALTETAQTLVDAGVPHLVFSGDVGDPDALMRDLAQKGATNPDKILHVRSFIDHNRSYAPPRDLHRLALRRAGVRDGRGTFVARSGGLIETADMEQSLVEHLERWARVVGAPGLLFLEVFCQDRIDVASRDMSPSLHFDAYHALSHQWLVTPAVFWRAAAEAGLFPAAGFKRYPRSQSSTRITLGRVFPHPFLIRRASEEDLGALLGLEEACWPEKLRNTERIIAGRIRRYPQGQHVAVDAASGRLLGVLYTQRVSSLETLRGASFDGIDELHREDGPVVQLLGLSVDPSAPYAGVGSRLLGFALLQAELASDVLHVAGITRCQRWKEQEARWDSYAAYARGGTDPGLQFHVSHGAEVAQVVESYRPEDAENDGHGVLICYRMREDANGPQAVAGSTAFLAVEDVPGLIRDALGKTIGRPMNPGDVLPAQATWRELGLTSLELVIMRAHLDRYFEQRLPETLLIDHPTVQALEDHLGKLTSGEKGRTFDDEWRDPAGVIDGKTFYLLMKRRGYTYGPSFRAVEAVKADGTKALVEWRGSWIPFMDAILQSPLISDYPARDTLAIPVSIREVRIHPPGPQKATQVAVSLDRKRAIATCPWFECRGWKVKVIPRAQRAPARPTMLRSDFVPYGNTVDDSVERDEYIRTLEAYGVGLLRDRLPALEHAYPHLGRVKELARLSHAAVPAEWVPRFLSHEQAIIMRICRDLLGTDEAFRRTMENPIAAIVSHPEHASLYSCDMQARGFGPLVLDRFLSIIEENTAGALAVCEVGTGTGGLTRQVFDRHSEHPIERYVATDITSAFAADLQAEIPAEEIRCDLWDINTPAPIRLGSPFDAILATNGIHVSDDLSITLGHLHDALREGGFLCFYEATTLCVPLLWGLDPSCWRFKDERAFGLWTSIGHWLRLLEAAGFQTVCVHRAPGDSAAFFLCRKPRRPRTWITLPAPSSDDRGEKIGSWLRTYSQAIEAQRDPAVCIEGGGPDQSGVVALVRSARREPGGERLRCVYREDGRVPTAEQMARVRSTDLVMNVFRDGAWGSYRRRPVSPAPAVPARRRLARVSLTNEGMDVRWFPLPDPSDGEADCAVRFVGLNFRDIMLASGKLSRNDMILPRYLEEREVGFATEFSGETADGRRLMGIVANALATHVNARESFLQTVPEGWTLEEAATVPVAYTTAYYALVMRGRIRRGQTALVHSGAGGVGLAAIRIALHRGLEVFATCGSEDKKRFLQSVFPELPPDHIGSSRDASFEDMVMRLTGRRGVDVILNSLSGDLLTASLRCLAPFGTFLEIGKYDILEGTKVSMEHWQANTTFHGVDITQLMDHPEDWNEVRTLLSAGMESGEVRALPRTVYPFEEAEKAVRLMSAGRHTGKLLLRMDGEAAGPAVPELHPSPKSTFLITGGLGGFGLDLALWLARRGCGRLVLSSRRGVRTGRQALVVAHLRESLGVQVVTTTLDASKDGEAEELVRMSHTAEFPLGGVFHLAMVLEDRLLANQTAESWEAVVSPKMAGCRNLDRLTRTIPSLSCFVVFSSIAALFGNPGQANYAYANMAMEAVCERRRQAGLHALAVRWGPVGDTGFVAETDRQLNEGISMLSQQPVSSCLSSLDSLLAGGESGVVTVFLESDKPLVRRTSEDLSLAQAVLRILGLKEEAVQPDTRLKNTGIDSLQIVEVQAAINRFTGRTLPLPDIQNLTFDALSRLASQQGTVEEKEPGRSGTGPAAVGTGESLIEKSASFPEDPPAAPMRVIYFLGGLGTDPSFVESGLPMYLVRWERASEPDQLRQALEAHLEAQRDGGGIELWGHSVGAMMAHWLHDASEPIRRRVTRRVAISPPARGLLSFLRSVDLGVLLGMTEDERERNLRNLPFLTGARPTLPIAQFHAQSILLKKACPDVDPLRIRCDLVVLPRRDSVTLTPDDAARIGGQAIEVEGEHDIHTLSRETWRRISRETGRPRRRGTIVLFPGQGSQRPGMGAELFPRHPRELKTASEILGYDLVPLCGGGGDHLLDQTQYAQPAIFVVNALAFTEHVLRSGNPRFAAGHSLGEYNALLAAGVFDFETGLGIVKKRGELMQRAAGGAMAAVIGLPTERIQSLLREHDLEALDVANINSPDQTVISGPRPLVETARSVFEGRGGRYVVLKVSGAFHSRYMRIITEEFRAFLGEVALKEPEIPVIANVTGRPYGADEVRSGLVDQLVSPVRWVDTIAWLAGQGDYDFLELGTGTVLTRLTEQILPATGRREDGG